jgi:hypothetical protein
LHLVCGSYVEVARRLSLLHGYDIKDAKRMVREVSDALRAIILEGGVARLPDLGAIYVAYCRVTRRPTGKGVKPQKDYVRIRFRGLRSLTRTSLRRLLDG